MHILLAQATVPVDFNPLILSVIPIVGALAWYITNIMKRQDEIVKRQDETFKSTIAQNAELVTALNKAGSDNAALWADNKELQKDLDFLKRQVTVLENRANTLEKEIASLRSASDAERQQFNQRSIEYQDKIKTDAKTIEVLQASIDKLNIEVADLKAQIKVLTGLLTKAGERDQLQKDADKPAAVVDMPSEVNITDGPDVGIAS